MVNCGKLIMELTSQIDNHRFEIQIMIRDVNDKDAVCFQVALINLERLFRQKMNWDCVAAEGVQREQVKLLGRLALHRKPRIAHDDLNLGRTVRSEEHTSELQSRFGISYAV